MNEFEKIIGNSLYVRTMGAIKLGKLIGISPSTMILEQACWLADPDIDGSPARQQENVLLNGLTGNPDFQIYPDPIYINRGVIESFTAWRHKLPKR